MDMTRTTATQLKAKLGRFMRAVRAGEEVVITDRGVCVARLVPFRETSSPPSGLPLSRARDPSAPRPGDIGVRGIRYKGPSTSDLLRDDRSKR